MTKRSTLGKMIPQIIIISAMSKIYYSYIILSEILTLFVSPR